MVLQRGGNQPAGVRSSAPNSLRVILKQQLHGSIDACTGTIPSSIYDLAQLREINVHSNKLYGKIDPRISGCTKLQSLVLRENRLSGSLPVELASLQLLEVLDFSVNQLVGTLPPTKPLVWTRREKGRVGLWVRL